VAGITANSFNLWLGIITSVGFVAGFIVATYRHFHKKFTISVMNELKPVSAQLTTNGESN